MLIDAPGQLGEISERCQDVARKLLLALGRTLGIVLPIVRCLAASSVGLASVTTS